MSSVERWRGRVCGFDRMAVQLRAPCYLRSPKTRQAQEEKNYTTCGGIVIGLFPTVLVLSAGPLFKIRRAGAFALPRCMVLFTVRGRFR